jgi:hypothetical protein
VFALLYFRPLFLQLRRVLFHVRKERGTLLSSLSACSQVEYLRSCVCGT